MVEAFSHLKPDHVFYGEKHVFFARDVEYIDITDLEKQYILVKLRGVEMLTVVAGFAALEMVWAFKPGALEGKRVKFPKHSWIIHNLIAHPVMQLLAFARCYKAAMWVHDITVPKPARRTTSA